MAKYENLFQLSRHIVLRKIFPNCHQKILKKICLIKINVFQRTAQNVSTDNPTYSHQHQEDTQIKILGSIVRIVSLVDDPENETDHNPQKYRFIKTQGLQRHLPDALIIGE